MWAQSEEEITSFSDMLHYLDSNIGSMVSFALNHVKFKAKTAMDEVHLIDVFVFQCIRVADEIMGCM